MLTLVEEYPQPQQRFHLFTLDEEQQNKKIVIECCFFRSKAGVEKEKDMNWQPDQFSGNSGVPHTADRTRNSSAQRPFQAWDK